MCFSIMLCQETLCLYKREVDLPVLTSSFIYQSYGGRSSQSSSAWPRVLWHALWCRCSNESKCWVTFCWLVFYHLTRWSHSMETTHTTHTATEMTIHTQTHFCMMMKSCSAFFFLYLSWIFNIMELRYRNKANRNTKSSVLFTLITARGNVWET